ncbi:hypothetical protein GE09DRAFT_581227 [Coniochaeta sp. 2T2.1]|nr:hypothetical protein GE09DRAFT_581227 [Coniochaeta sp. 2T2.1]
MRGVVVCILFRRSICLPRQDATQPQRSLSFSGHRLILLINLGTFKTIKSRSSVSTVVLDFHFQCVPDRSRGSMQNHCDKDGIP